MTFSPRYAHCSSVKESILPALKRRFDLDDDYLEDVKDELIYAKHLAVDEEKVPCGRASIRLSASPAPDT